MEQLVKFDDVTISIWRFGDDPTELLRIMRKTHGAEATPEWLSAKTSWGRGGIAALAYDQGKAIGLALLGPAPYLCHGQSVEVLQSMYNFVEAPYRGRGIYKRLLFAVNDACKAAGFDLAITLPNSLSRPGFIRSGWQPLPAMQSFVHVPILPSLHKAPLRMQRILTSRNLRHRAGESTGVTEADIQKLAQLARSDGQSKVLQHSMSEAALTHRFSQDRGDGYSIIFAEGAGAIVRVGSRGSAREVRLLATSPRSLPASSLKQLMAKIRHSFNPDFISHIESTENTSRLQYSKSGLYRISEVTIPFWTSFNSDITSLDIRITGIDLHLW